MDPSQYMQIDTLRDDPLLGLDLLHIEDPKEDNVSSILMKNGSRIKRAKRGEQMVSIGNLSGHFKHETKSVRNCIDATRKREERTRKKKGPHNAQQKQFP
jgi:hypothetical protein